MWTVLIPKLWPWIAASALWSVATTGNDMVITNLFQVKTVTESVYQQVQFNELNSGSVWQACSFAILVGAMVLLIAAILSRKVGSESNEMSGPADFQAFGCHGIVSWLGTILGWGIVSMTVLIPLANLLVKAGWVATMENEQPRRGWSPWVLIDSVVQSRTFANEILWSVQLGLYSSIVAIVLALLLVRCSTWACVAWFAIGMSAFSLAIPGPIVNLFILRLFDRSEPEWIGFLADRTLLGPILAQQTRCLPIIFGMLWIANQRYQRHNENLLRLDQGLPFLTRMWVHAKAMSTPIAMAFAVSFFVSFADLATYLLVQPPQVTTVAMRMFDLLHYGIKNRESGLALSLALAGAIPTTYLVGRFRRN
jgi:iron(III) transport system permease protein